VVALVIGGGCDTDGGGDVGASAGLTSNMAKVRTS